MNLFKSSDQLRRQVYEHFRNHLAQGVWKPGDFVNTNKIAKELGISKTPLRDAIIRLETEDFVTILPQRGVIINSLSSLEVGLICEMLGALESKVVASVFHHLGKKEISKLKRINAELLNLALEVPGNFKDYVDCNLKFHDVFLNLSENNFIIEQIKLRKQRIYEFPTRDFGATWRQKNVMEHEMFIQLIENGKAKEAADFLRDVHWVFCPPEVVKENAEPITREANISRVA